MFRGKTLKKIEGFVSQEEIFLDDGGFKVQNNSIVIDNEFLEMNHPSLDKVIIFARIPAESKAKIIASIKN